MNLTLCDWCEPALVVSATYQVVTNQNNPPENSSTPTTFTQDLCDTHWNELRTFMQGKGWEAKGFKKLPYEGVQT
jgi:hypothetical protein